MNKNNSKILIIIVFIIMFLSKTLVFAKALNSVSSQNLAVALVIDTSGSMSATDPQKLRQTAANIFIDLLSPNDYLSIITFNTKVEVVLPMQQIKSSKNKTNFKRMLSQKLVTTGDTDYLLALSEASNQLKSLNRANLHKAILFLTDGKPEPVVTKKNDVKFMKTYMNSLWKKVSNLALNKHAVYCVGFSKFVDPVILEKISKATGGDAKISDTTGKLSVYFVDVLKTIKSNKSISNKMEESKKSNNIETNSEQHALQTTKLIMISAVLLLIIILLGLLLYIILVYRNTIIRGKLLYWKESDFEAENKKEFDFNKLRKNSVVISFNREDKSAQYHIFDSEYDYNIQLISIVQKSRFKFIDGFKAIFNRNNSSELLLKTTKPGIFIYEDKVFTSKKIYKNDKFSTGGYVFQYFIH